MAAELVMLAERAATLEEWVGCAESVVGTGMVRGYAGGATHLLDADGNGVVVYWEPRQLENRREAIEMVGEWAAEAAARSSLWIDVALRFGNEDAGRAVVTAVADRIGAVVVEGR